jgi:hypothetical protein
MHITNRYHATTGIGNIKPFINQTAKISNS